MQAVLIDVGGTLWPNSWPRREGDSAGRAARVHLAMPRLSADEAAALAHEIAADSSDLNGGTTMVAELIRVDANVVVAQCLERRGITPEPLTVARVRRAMGLAVDERITPLPGARELLRTIRQLDLRCVIASNTYWRDAQDYWEDFGALRMAEHIDAIVTSVDAGQLKPHPAVFELSVRAAGVPASDCIFIGNSEVNDIVPAHAMGMRSILVHPDDPPPATTVADAVAPDLWKCAEALRFMLGRK